MDRASRMLGRRFSIRLRVEHGNQIGRLMDFPTINQVFPRYHIVPRYGVYSTVVKIDGKLYGVYPLSENREVEIDHAGHTNHITIKDGTVAMTSSSCKNQVCVQTGAISQTKDVIVCLPNKILVEIIGDKHKGGGVDVISG